MVSLSPEILGYITDLNNGNARAQLVDHAAEADFKGLASYDPFENVVLISNIDNQILTSFRTLRGDNNFFSDTQKVVHKKFLPQKPYPGLNHKVPNQRQYKVQYLLEGESMTPMLMIPEFDTRDNQYFETDVMDVAASHRQGHTQQLMSIRQTGNGTTIDE